MTALRRKKIKTIQLIRNQPPITVALATRMAEQQMADTKLTTQLQEGLQEQVGTHQTHIKYQVTCTLT